MITYITGDIFKQEVEALVNPVNCVGVMGKGLALQFKEKFFDNYCLYKKACERDKVAIGSMFVTQTYYLTPPYFIINFPTKKHWRALSKLEYIEEGLYDLVKAIDYYSIKSIAIPPLGCGLGGLNWEDVKALIDKILVTVDCEITVLRPQ